LVARINQIVGKPLGFLNPTLYQMLVQALSMTSLTAIMALTLLAQAGMLALV